MVEQVPQTSVPQPPSSVSETTQPNSSRSKDSLLYVLLLFVGLLIGGGLVFGGYLWGQRTQVQNSSEQMDEVHDEESSVEEPALIEGWTRASDLNPKFKEIFGFDFQFPSSWSINVDGLSEEAFMLFLTTDEGHQSAYDNIAITFMPAKPVELMQVIYPGWSMDSPHYYIGVVENAKPVSDIDVNGVMYKRLYTCETAVTFYCSTIYLGQVDSLVYEFWIREKSGVEGYEENIEKILNSMTYGETVNNYYQEVLDQQKVLTPTQPSSPH